MRKFSILLLAFILITSDGFSQYKASDYLRAALVATKKKKYDQAILLCDAAINLNNNYESAYFHRGYNKMLLKDYAGALIDFSIVIDLNSENLDAYLYRALTNQKAGKKWAATEDYNSARRIDTFQTMAFITTNLIR
ncbi:MAG: Tetratricopeptide TPR2 repeat protein [Bacteroidetes bacterium]|jgi:tetratricopeptide (TPR) repeat protein|nr:MAG: Tetratricopeptide TPR2 repeat protein [Bacteroidota bacterium]